MLNFHTVEFKVFNVGEKAPIIPCGNPVPPTSGEPQPQINAPMPAMAYWFRVCNKSNGDISVVQNDVNAPKVFIKAGDAPALFPSVSNHQYKLDEIFILADVSEAIVAVEFCY